MKQFSLTVLLSIVFFIPLTSCEIKENNNSETEPTPLVETTSQPTALPDASSNVDKWEETEAKQFLKISAIRTKPIVDGIYETEGYIVDKVFPCDCPPKMKCKCDPPSITISEQNNEVLNGGKLRDYEIRIGTTPPEGLDQGEKYRFKVKVDFEKYDSSKKDEVGMVAYK